MIEGEIECASITQAVEVLEEIKRRMENVPVRRSLEQAAEIVAQRTELNFANSEDPAGNPWAPVQRPMPPPILIQTQLLRRSAIAAARNPRISGNALLIDASVPWYGVKHLIGGVHLAKREWLGFTEAHVDAMAVLACDNAVQFIFTGEGGEIF